MCRGVANIKVSKHTTKTVIYNSTSSVLSAVNVLSICKTSVTCHTRLQNISHVRVMRASPVSCAFMKAFCRRRSSICFVQCMFFALRSASLFSGHNSILLFKMLSTSSSSHQVICNVTPAAIASFPPSLTTCISNARDVSAAKLNDVRACCSIVSQPVNISSVL